MRFQLGPVGQAAGGSLVIHNAARVRRMLREAERRGVIVAPLGLHCVARVGKHAVRVVCNRKARYLTDEFRVPVCGLHHPRLLAERLFGAGVVT